MMDARGARGRAGLHRQAQARLGGASRRSPARATARLSGQPRQSRIENRRPSGMVFAARRPSRPRRTKETTMREVDRRRRRRLRAGLRRPRAGPGKAHRLVGEGLLQVRGRRAVRGDQEVRGQERRQGRALAVPDPGHDPEDGRRARRRHRRPTSPTPTSTTSRSPASGRSTASSRTSATCSTPMKARFAHEHARDDLPLQRQDQEARVLRLPAQAADDAHRDTGSTC